MESAMGTGAADPLQAENPRDSQGSLPKTAPRAYLNEIAAEL
jgi:hypothetical protein